MKKNLIFKGLDLVCNVISAVQLRNTGVDTIRLLMVLHSGFNFRTVLIGGFAGFQPEMIWSKRFSALLCLWPENYKPTFVVFGPKRIYNISLTRFRFRFRLSVLFGLI